MVVVDVEVVVTGGTVVDVDSRGNSNGKCLGLVYCGKHETSMRRRTVPPTVPPGRCSAVTFIMVNGTIWCNSNKSTSG